MKSFWFILACSTLPLFGQQGDKPGELQAPPPAAMKIPPAPPLSTAEALESFRLQPGFRIELVASEPMVEAPVEIEFDADGSLYVLEMRGFMPNVEGKGEDQPNGRVSRLEDTDGDGRMDQSTVFADGLRLPRAIALVRGGLLAAEPPYLWFFKDTNADGKADVKEEVSRDYGNQKNPEHTANGLLWGRDNWIYSANHTLRYRPAGHGWEKEPVAFRGQWGITQDDYGRLFFNSNSDHLRGDLVPAQYLSRNDHFKSPTGANVQIARDQSTFPARVNPGVNRGYQKGTLRPDGRLARFTGACGPVIYRGGLFPAQFYGAAFVCEPTANLVRCDFLREDAGMITATNAFPNAEFLASVDERFRPVNLSNGPDGALYVVDMYRGVIQHRIYLTTFLRNQALDRGLETPLNYGRIYRVVPDGAPRPSATKLARLTSSELTGQLTSPNGWVRDTAQRLLVERADFVAAPLLQRLAAGGEFPAAVHALWVLHGTESLDPATAHSAMNSAHAKVRATAVRVAEAFLRDAPSSEVSRKIMALAADPAAEVRLQVMFSLGEAHSPAAETAMLDLLQRDADHPLLRDAAVSGLEGRELPFLQQLLARSNWNEQTAGRKEVIRDLAQCIATSRDPGQVNQLLQLAAGPAQPWQQYALLDGIAALIPPAGRNKNPAPPKPLRLASEPVMLAALKKTGDKAVQQRLTRLEPLLSWPGKEGAAEAEVQPLSEEGKRLFEAGRTQYQLICGACHQPNGLGLEGLAPPLADSDWVTGSPERLARIVLNGVRGPINVKGKIWELDMPPLFILSDTELAGLLTYVRREWGHTASAITPEFIGKVRESTADRMDAWTEPELLKIK